jgi:hypothetical protein
MGTPVPDKVPKYGRIAKGKKSVTLVFHAGTVLW